MTLLDNHQSQKEENKCRRWYRDKIADSTATYHEMLEQAFRKNFAMGVAVWIVGSIVHLIWIILLHWGMALCEDDSPPFDPDKAQGAPKDDYP